MKIKFKSALASLLAAAMLLTAAPVSAFAQETQTPDTPAEETENTTSPELPAIWADGNPQTESADRNAIDVVRWFDQYDIGKQVTQTGSSESTHYYLFLPSTADLSALTIWHTFKSDPTVGGKAVKNGEKTDAFSETGDYTVTADGKEITLTVMKSQSVGSIYIDLADGGIEKVHAAKTNKVEGDILVVESDGKLDYSGALSYIKGRGNTTWSFSKKPYNIKLDKKASLLGMDSCKKWCLLANAQDHSMVRNRIAYDLANEVGLTPSPDSQFADLYIDGEYAGVYQLSEKVEEGKNNLVKINDLTDSTEKANGGTDLDKFAQVKDGKGEGSKKYFDIPNDPEDITGGYLLEFDSPGNYDEEPSGFVTKRGQYVVVKGPENASKAQIEYISEFCRDMEDAIYSPDGRNGKGKHYSEYIDTESAALMYLLQEFSLNVDAGMTSCFFYKDSDAKGDGKLHAAPAWDFDVAFGNLDSEFGDDVRFNTPDAVYVEDRVNWTMSDLCIFARLCSHKDFYEVVLKMYNERFKPALDILNDPNPVSSMHLKSLVQYRAELEPSTEMNYKRWRLKDNLLVSAAGKTFAAQQDYLADFTTKRAAFFDTYFAERPVSDNLSVYFYNIDGWEDVYVYVPNTDMEWPGVKLEHIPYEDYLEYLLKADLGALGIKDDGFVRGVFNDGKDFSAPDTRLSDNTAYRYFEYEYTDDAGNPMTYKYVDHTEFNEAYIVRKEIVKGDVDGDGSVTSGDALTLLRYSLEMDFPHSRQEYTACVIDDDYDITSSDALHVLRYSVGSGENPFNVGSVCYDYEYTRTEDGEKQP